MEAILNMPVTPDFIEYLTWVSELKPYELYDSLTHLTNDGPESHYCGNLWEEQNNDTRPSRYANQKDWDHSAWQPLLASFAQAFKAELGPHSMTTPNEEVAIGALWYKTVLQSTICPTEPDLISEDYEYSVKPDGFETGTDQLNWAVVIPFSSSGLSIRAISNGQVISTVQLTAGLNYGSATGVSEGQQRLELVDSSGTVVLAATGGRCISSNCPDCIYNMNPQVVALSENRDFDGPCPDPPDDCYPVLTGDGDDGYGDEDYVVCDYSITFDSLDDLNAHSGSLRSDCMAAYTLEVLISMLDVAYTNYTTNVTDGYDALFDYYVKYINKLVPEVLENEFMWNMSTTEEYNLYLPNVGYGMNCTNPYF